MASDRVDNSLHTRASEVIGRLRKLNSRLSRVTTNIAGCVPESSPQEAKPIEEYLNDKLDTVHYLINEMESEMSRLETSVGSHSLQPSAPKAVGY